MIVKGLRIWHRPSLSGWLDDCRANDEFRTATLRCFISLSGATIDRPTLESDLSRVTGDVLDWGDSFAQVKEQAHQRTSRCNAPGQDLRSCENNSEQVGRIVRAILGARKHPLTWNSNRRVSESDYRFRPRHCLSGAAIVEQEMQRFRLIPVRGHDLVEKRFGFLNGCH